MNAAIYYPSISFHDSEWLLAASLLWDKIYRIVPQGVKFTDDPKIRPLIESGDIGINLAPPENLKELASKFLNEIKHYDTAAAFSFGVNKSYTNLHRDKLDVRLRSVLDEFANCKNGWYGVPTDFATHYMCYLANYIAEKNNLHVISDDSGAWVSESWFRYGGGFDDRLLEHQDGIEKVLAIISIPEITPYNFSNCNVETIIKIREKYKDERELFTSYISDISKKFSSFENKDVAQDYIECEKKKIHSAIQEYQKSIGAVSKNRLMGKLSFLLPLSASVADFLLGGAYSFSNMVPLPIEGAVAGALCGIYSHTKNINKQPINISYLLSLQTAWKNLRGSDLDYNYYLYRDIEEFIND